MYIDPNTGGMLFQVLAVMFGAISGVILLLAGKISMLVSRTLRFFRGVKKHNNDIGHGK